MIEKPEDFVATPVHQWAGYETMTHRDGTTHDINIVLGVSTVKIIGTLRSADLLVEDTFGKQFVAKLKTFLVHA